MLAHRIRQQYPLILKPRDHGVPCLRDRANRQFAAERPNASRVADFSHVSTGQGFVRVAFVVDAYSRRMVGRKASGSARADFVLDTLETLRAPAARARR